MLDEKESPEVIRKTVKSSEDEVDVDKKENLGRHMNTSPLEKKPISSNNLDNKAKSREELKTGPVINNNKKATNNKDLVSPQLTSAAARARELKMNWLNKQNSMKNNNDTRGT